MTAFPRCAAGTTIREACIGLVDDLHDRWDLPSVYLLVDGRLRCQASRGYFQVSDGFPTTTGVIGRVVSSGERQVLQDVTLDPAFIAAIPGLRSEACLPVRVHGVVVGAVNLESRTTLDAAAVDDLEAAAAVLGRRLEALGGLPRPSLAERLGRIAVTMAGQTEVAEVQRLAVTAALELSGMTTAALARRQADHWSMLHAEGPLADVLLGWDQQALRTLGTWVWSGTSAYFPDNEHVPVGYEFLGPRIHALSAQPLVVAGEVVGLLLTANTEPAGHDPLLTAALELLASQTAATLAMAETLDALALQASRDPLTGLANRRRLLESLAVAGSSGSAALVLLDLDGFKQINDDHGHAEGDALLSAVARRLESCARQGDVVCRLGGDEFVVLAQGVEGPEEAEALGRRLIDAVAAPSAGTWHPSVGVSAGVRLVQGGTSSSLLVDADAALYAAKHRGRGHCVVWAPSLRQEALDQRALVEDLLVALRTDCLRIVYQPIVDAGSLAVCGVEALARWHDPDRGIVSPGLFVAAAERAGVVPELTRWVLRTVCQQVASWEQPWLKIGLNVSGAQLATDEIVTDVRDALAASGMGPGQLVLEVTETSAVVDLERASQTLEALSALGVGLALDDFGTGYSSLTHAHTLPFDILKIDRSFVAGSAAGDKRAVATVAAIATLGAQLGVDIVAEGVEDLTELPALIALGCHFAQGYALSRPLEASAVTRNLLAQGAWVLGRPLAAVPDLPDPRPQEALRLAH